MDSKLSFKRNDIIWISNIMASVQAFLRPLWTVNFTWEIMWWWAILVNVQAFLSTLWKRELLFFIKGSSIIVNHFPKCTKRTLRGRGFKNQHFYRTLFYGHVLNSKTITIFFFALIIQIGWCTIFEGVGVQKVYSLYTLENGWQLWMTPKRYVIMSFIFVETSSLMAGNLLKNLCYYVELIMITY